MDKRVERSFLFGLKYVLVKWGFTKSVVWVDLEGGTLPLGSELAVQVKVEDFKLFIDYGDGWEEYLKDSEVEELFKQTESKLLLAQNSGTLGEPGGNLEGHCLGTPLPGCSAEASTNSTWGSYA